MSGPQLTFRLSMDGVQGRLHRQEAHFSTAPLVVIAGEAPVATCVVERLIGFVTLKEPLVLFSYAQSGPGAYLVNFPPLEFPSINALLHHLVNERKPDAPT